jgi:hypothetical protein
MRRALLLIPLLCLACVEKDDDLATTGDAGADGDTPGTRDDDGESGTWTDPDCPQSADFVSVSAHPANSAYPDPFLSVSCDDDTLVVQSNGIPTYEYVDMTPNGLSAVDYTWEIPANPALAAAPTDIPLLGTAAFTVAGLPIFGPNEAAQPDPYGDPVYNGIVDACLGHTGQGGSYHHHALLVSCVLSAVADDAPDMVVGYALDGFAIHGPVGCVDTECGQTATYESGWVQTGDPTTYAWDNHEYQQSDDPTVLDQCNGHTGPGGDYHYHATESFPYILGCFSGSASGDGGGDAGGDAGGDEGDEGDEGGGGQGDPPECEDVADGMPCCGDDVCDGPETADNCPADCG